MSLVELQTRIATAPPKDRKPRVLLINPRIQPNYWTLTETFEITGAKALMPSLALLTLGAMVPEEQYDLEVVDENVGETGDGFYDVVGITGFSTQSRRMRELAASFREAGSLVAIGGPFASLSPHILRESADVLFLGEAEGTWPQFLSDYLGGRVRATYEADEVDIELSPLPRNDLAAFSLYSSGVVQTSRGCPFSCEFCDVIVYLGRKQRHKTPEQVVTELEAQYTQGVRSIFLADDNFTSKPKAARAIVDAIREWNSSKAEPATMHTQLSVDIAAPRNADLLAGCVDAGIVIGFIGLETDDDDALRSVDKLQNTRRDVYESVRTVHQAGMQIHAGLMLGFDTDDKSCFEDRFDFVQATGIPIFSVSVLNAPFGTPLYESVAEQGRILDEGEVDLFFKTNMKPLQMSEDELTAGAVWLVNRIYHPAAFIERFMELGRQLPDVSYGDRSEGISAEAVDVWSKTRQSFESFDLSHDVPRAALRAMRGKDVRHLYSILMYYRNILGILRYWGLLDHALAEFETFESATAYVMDKKLVRI